MKSLIEKLREEAKILKPPFNQKDLEQKNKLIDLIEKLLDLDPNQRPSCQEAADLLAHIAYVHRADPPPI
ncbi:MAG: hypothetical protein HWD61_01395 [Parachlamydiaceae bacterium]|nr:MAG: hypothetical protein HWD61_01395 [Parachlamydiaceae bacterium]